MKLTYQQKLTALFLGVGIWIPLLSIAVATGCKRDKPAVIKDAGIAPSGCLTSTAEFATLSGETVVARTVGNKVTVSIHYPDNTESEVLHLEDSGWHVSK